MDIRNLALQAAIAGIIAGAGITTAHASDGVGDGARAADSKDKHGCNGPNGCGSSKKNKEKEKDGCSGPNGCNGKKGHKDKNGCNGPNGCGSKKK